MQLIKLLSFSENVSCLINTTIYCGLLTPATPIEGEKTKRSLFLWLPDNMVELFIVNFSS